MSNHERWLKTTAETAMRLLDVLTVLSNRAPSTARPKHSTSLPPAERERNKRRERTAVSDDNEGRHRERTSAEEESRQHKIWSNSTKARRWMFDRSADPINQQSIKQSK